MAFVQRRGWAIGLALGMLVGLVLGGLWPNTPLHATATDRSENFSIATGFIDDGTEAVFFLDSLTGSLRGAVLANAPPVGFQTRFETNVLRDLAASLTLVNGAIAQENALRKKKAQPPRPEVQLPQAPRFMMVTGAWDLRQGVRGRIKPGRCAVYVAEASTGVLLAYGINWTPDDRSKTPNVPSVGSIVLLCAEPFATVVTRTE